MILRNFARSCGQRSIGGPPEQLAEHLKREIKRRGDVARDAALAQQAVARG